MTVDTYYKLPRLYVPDAEPDIGLNHLISDGQHHYLKNVMRIEVGDQLRIFNGCDGEWLSGVKDINKKNVVIEFIKLISEQKNGFDIEVLASPVKKEAFDLMIEKACELGARAFQPVICERTIVHRVNEERMQSIAIEAAEQCERLDIMETNNFGKLKDVINSWDKNKKLIFCVERAKALPILQALDEQKPGTSLGILIGPEGGFSQAEVDYLMSLPFVMPVSLGERILRAETAMITALSVLQAWLDKK